MTDDNDRVTDERVTAKDGIVTADKRVVVVVVVADVVVVVVVGAVVTPDAAVVAVVVGGGDPSMEKLLTKQPENPAMMTAFELSNIWSHCKISVC